MSKTAIMLGGNLPGTPQAMEYALSELTNAGFIIEKISSPFHSAAVDCLPGTPDFIDRALIGEWSKTPVELLEICQKTEIAAGRPAQHSSRESRILDLDIILFDNLKIDTPDLIIPHPRAAQREFVLSPLAEIAPEWEFPNGKSVKCLLQELQSS